MNKTVEIKNKYVGRITRSPHTATALSGMLVDAFGDEIHEDIEGYIKFCEDNKTLKADIEFNLIHDLWGAINEDTRMMPRVTGYRKFLNNHTVTDNTTK
jgi:hypothetical protein